MWAAAQMRLARFARPPDLCMSVCMYVCLRACVCTRACAIPSWGRIACTRALNHHQRRARSPARSFLERRLAAVRGVTIITPRDPSRRGAQLSLVLDVPVRAVQAGLAGAGVIVDVREPFAMRVAPAPLYNSYGDVAAFVAGAPPPPRACVYVCVCVWGGGVRCIALALGRTCFFLVSPQCRSW